MSTSDTERIFVLVKITLSISEIRFVWPDPFALLPNIVCMLRYTALIIDQRWVCIHVHTYTRIKHWVSMIISSKIDMLSIFGHIVQWQVQKITIHFWIVFFHDFLKITLKRQKVHVLSYLECLEWVSKILILFLFIYSLSRFEWAINQHIRPYRWRVPLATNKHTLTHTHSHTHTHTLTMYI